MCLRRYHEAADILRSRTEAPKNQNSPGRKALPATEGSLWAFRKKPEDLNPEECQSWNGCFSWRPS